VPDGTTVLITTTQEITSLTIALNGASAIYGGVTFLGAGTATAIRFYQPTNSWYQINAETVHMISKQVKIVAEGANGPTTPEAAFDRPPRKGPMLRHFTSLQNRLSALSNSALTTTDLPTEGTGFF
jgi:hypothetical protein